MLSPALVKLVDALKSTVYVTLKVLPAIPVFANALTARTSEKVRILVQFKLFIYKIAIFLISHTSN